MMIFYMNMIGLFVKGLLGHNGCIKGKRSALRCIKI